VAKAAEFPTYRGFSMKKLEDDPQIKGMIGGSKVSLVFLIALVIFGNSVQFSIILALVAGFSYGLLVAWWHGKDEPPAQPLLRTFEQVIPRKKGHNNINFARDERKKQKQIQVERAKARAEKLFRPKLTIAILNNFTRLRRVKLSARGNLT
jgi:hypothetical protein